MRTGRYKLVVDDQFDRAWRRVGLALDRIGFTVVDRDRSRGVYFVRFGDPDLDAKNGNEEHLARKLAVLEDRRQGQARAVPDRGRPRPTPISVVSVQDPGGVPDKSATSEKILALLKDQLK